MTVVNGLPITDNLVGFLNLSFEQADSGDTSFDSDVNAMMELNDFLIDYLMTLDTSDVDEMILISNHLVCIKAAKDRMKSLSSLLKECKSNKKGAQL